MAEPVCDFVPSECAALAIQACILAKKCALADIDFAGVQEQVARGLEAAAELKASLDLLNTCTLDGIKSAFVAAGCDVPVFPETPAPPDLSGCTAALEQVAEQATGDILAFLAPFMTITLDANDLPIRITVP